MVLSSFLGYVGQMIDQDHVQKIIGIMSEVLLEIADPHSVCDPHMLAGFALKRILELEDTGGTPIVDKRPRIDIHAFNGA